jgi:hypothetical protein
MITPKIDIFEAEKEYMDNVAGATLEGFEQLWLEHPKSIRLIYGWLLGYQDVLDWIAHHYFKGFPNIPIYPAFTKNACTKDGKVFFGIKRDYNHDLDFGIIIHELMHIRYKSSVYINKEEAVEIKTKELVKHVNERFNLKINHG